MATLTRDFLKLHFLIFFIVLFPSASSVYFQMPRFDPSVNSIIYQGDAAPSVGAIEMNNKFTYLCRVGWATYAEKVPLWDPDTGKLSDFNTKFSFVIDTQKRVTYGNGLTFFLAPADYQIPPNSAGGFLGLFNTTTAYSSSNKIVMVEFDSFSNPEWDPPDVKDHVGINNNSIISTVYTRWNASFHSGDTADVRITYNATNKNLSVSWSYRETSTSQENTNLSYTIDLMKVLPEWVTIGFSAATGENLERHILQSWEFSSTLDRKGTNNAMNKSKIKIIVAVTVSVAILIAGVITVLVILRRRKRLSRTSTPATKLTSINDDLERGAGPRRFSYKDLASATKNFADDRKLGEGGFGAVYRGYLQDFDMAVAVKKISKGSRQGKKEYITEVKTISQLRHRNLVQLIGWCHDDKGEFLLVYEFMPNGSLDSHLFSEMTCLTWAMRYKITLGLASALLYLHEEWEQCVVHRDIKSSNIMLDSNFNVKLGDFGLARLMDHELGPQTTGLAGTLGYMAPECFNTGRASKESDVFSFGVVVLEIVTGRKSIVIEKTGMGLVEEVWNLYGRGELLLGVDKRLDMDFDEQQVECLMIVGLWCAHPDYNFRPSIRQTIQALNLETGFPNLPTKMPVPKYHIPTGPMPSMSSSDATITNSSCIEVGR